MNTCMYDINTHGRRTHFINVHNRSWILKGVACSTKPWPRRCYRIASCALKAEFVGKSANRECVNAFSSQYGRWRFRASIRMGMQGRRRLHARTRQQTGGKNIPQWMYWCSMQSWTSCWLLRISHGGFQTTDEFSTGIKKVVIAGIYSNKSAVVTLA